LIGGHFPKAPATAERTTQILTYCIATMSKKLNAAVSASLQAVAQFRIGLQDGGQSGPVLTDKRVRAIALVPIRVKRENFLERDDKKARLSDTM
jgi:hypothetical protein